MVGAKALDVFTGQPPPNPRHGQAKDSIRLQDAIAFLEESETIWDGYMLRNVRCKYLIQRIFCVGERFGDVYRVYVGRDIAMCGVSIGPNDDFHDQNFMPVSKRNCENKDALYLPDGESGDQLS